MDKKYHKKPFTLIEPKYFKYPIIISSPHSGRYYPDSFIDKINVDIYDLRKLEDIFVDKIVSFISKELSIPCISSVFSRSYVDLNRDVNEIDINMISKNYINNNLNHSMKVRSGFGLFPKKTLENRNIYDEPLSRKEIEYRIKEIYYPWHSKLLELLEKTIKTFGKVLLLDFHSMPSNPFKTINSIITPEICISDLHGSSAKKIYIEKLKENLLSLNYNVKENYPFSGGYIARNYSNMKNISVIQIEIRRDIYADEDKLILNHGFDKLKRDMLVSVLSLANEFDDKQTFAAE